MKYFIKTREGFNYTYLTILFVLICIVIVYTVGWRPNLLQAGDQFGYNSYLTSLFIHKDIRSLNNTYEAKCKTYNEPITPAGVRNRIPEAPDAPNGNRVLKYFYGVSFLQAPFFLITHLFTKGNGYTTPYVFAIYLSSFIYVLFGLLLLYPMLREYVPARVALASIMLTFFGTNLLYFTLCNPGLSHPYLFFLFSCLLYFTNTFFTKEPTNLSAIGLGFTVGLIAVSRVTDLAILVIPGIYLIAYQKNKNLQGSFVQLNLKLLLLSIGVASLVIFPQLIYWKTTSGKWFYDTYPNEGFDFLKPHIREGLFSFKNGWLSYTPLMAFPLLYIFIFARTKKPLAIGILLFMIIHIYITYSWKEWYYNAGIGSRPMVEAYAVLIFPLAVGIKYIWKIRLLRYAMVFFLIFSVYINLLRILQVQTGNFIGDDATWQFNRQMLFKINTNLDDLYAYDLNTPQPGIKELSFIKNLGYQGFEQSSNNPKDSVIKVESGVSAKFSESNEFNDALEIGLTEQNLLGSFLQVNCQAYINSNVFHFGMGRIVVTIQRGDATVLWKAVRIHNKLLQQDVKPSLYTGRLNNWGKISFFVPVDIDTRPGDLLKIYGWNPGRVNFWIDDLSVDEYQPTRKEGK